MIRSAESMVNWQGTFYTTSSSAILSDFDFYRYAKSDSKTATPGKLDVPIIGAGVACANN
jgi:hypothetical protein